MGRRSRSNGTGDIVDLVALFPWWVGVGLALLSYWWLSAVAAQPLVVAGSGVPKVNLFAAIAAGLRYVVPILCLLGAVLSAWGRLRRRGLVEKAARDGSPAIAKMDWREFELLVGEAFRQRGYTVVETGGGGADGGVDLELRRGAEVTLVQCKHWKTYRVGLPVVREMLGAMTAKRASSGWVITSGRFTAEARVFAAEHRVELVDGEALPELLDAARAGAWPRAGARMRPQEPRAAQTPPASAPAAPTKGGHASAQSVPSCPVCAKPMRSRVAGKGASAGQSFWGCSGFPACRGTRPGPAVD